MWLDRFLSICEEVLDCAVYCISNSGHRTPGPHPTAIGRRKS